MKWFTIWVEIGGLSGGNALMLAFVICSVYHDDMDLDHSKLAFVDVETNGGWGDAGRIIELGVVRVEQGCVVATMETLVDPGTWLPPWITRLTGIEARQLDAAPTFDAVADELYELLEGCVFVAHNVGFDYGFVRREFAREGIGFEAATICTARLSRALFPGLRRHNLDSIIRRHGIEVGRRHRALDDARVLWELYGIMQRQCGSAALQAAAGRQLVTSQHMGR